MVQNTGNRLVQAINRQAGKVSYFCTAENISTNQTVHELRKSFKRLRALFRFYQEMPDSHVWQISDSIRNFGKLLAPVRESAVNIDIFDKEISSNTLIPERKIRNARDFLIQKNKLLLERGFWENNLCNTIGSFFEGFERLLQEAGHELPSKIHLFHEVNQSYLKSYSVYHELPVNPHPVEWHHLRKKLKQLWYQLDFIRFLHPRYFKLKTDQLNNITDQLGDDHDLHLFFEEILFGNYGFDQEELLIVENQIEHLRDLNLLKLNPRLKQFFTTPPAEFDQKMERVFKL